MVQILIKYANVAQQVAHIIGNDEVGSSNLLVSSKKTVREWTAFLFVRCLQDTIDIRL